MSETSCSRSWQAEAVLDHRLSAEDTASFERHLSTCKLCTHELRQLSRLKELGEQLPWPKTDALQRRRQRNELLRRAHGAEEAPPFWKQRRGAAALLVALSVFAVAAVVATHVLQRPLPPLVERGVGYEVLAGSGKAWHELQGGDDVRLQLSDGALTLRISKLKARQSFVLWLPDGELTVRGTTFTVETGAGQTRRVAVREGRVALRLAGRPELLLGPGQVWQIEPAAVASSAPPSPPAAPTPSSRRGTTVRRAPSTTPTAAAPGSAAASPTGTEPSTATDFALAMASFSRGDFATAEQDFRRFELRHPESSQVEDSVFLRAVARQRRGDAAGARALAAEYLRRFPKGFRASEARRLLGAP